MIEAVLVALHLEAAAVDRERRAFLDADIDIVPDLLDAPPRSPAGRNRPTDRSRCRSSATFDARNQLFHQPVGGGLADGHRDRDRHAALAGRAVAGADQRIDRLVHVGIRHDDGVVLGAAKTLRALAVRGRALIDVLRDRRGADKADRLDIGIVEDGVDRFLVAVDDVEDAGRQARLDHQFAPASSARRDRAPTASG